MANHKHSSLWQAILKLKGITPQQRKLALGFINRVERQELYYKKLLKDGKSLPDNRPIQLYKLGWEDKLGEYGYDYRSIFSNRQASDVLGRTFDWSATTNALPSMDRYTTTRF